MTTGMTTDATILWEYRISECFLVTQSISFIPLHRKAYRESKPRSNWRYEHTFGFRKNSHRFHYKRGSYYSNKCVYYSKKDERCASPWGNELTSPERLHFTVTSVTKSVASMMNTIYETRKTCKSAPTSRQLQPYRTYSHEFWRQCKEIKNA